MRLFQLMSAPSRIDLYNTTRTSHISASLGDVEGFLYNLRSSQSHQELEKAVRYIQDATITAFLTATQ